MIKGCTIWQEKGLVPPRVVTDATAAYLESEDAITAWIEDCCERCGEFTTRACLFKSWADWTVANGEHAGSNKRFVAALEARGFIPHRFEHGRGFLGLKLRQSLVSC